VPLKYFVDTRSSWLANKKADKKKRKGEKKAEKKKRIRNLIREQLLLKLCKTAIFQRF